MHGFTPISITGALTSLIVTPTILYALFYARRTGRFRTWWYVGPLLFETFFLVAYMTILSFRDGADATAPSALDAWLGAIHGIAALIVFIGFWAVLPIALRAYGSGRNLFAARPALTWGATAMRVIALVSGEAIFVFHWVV